MNRLCSKQVMFTVLIFIVVDLVAGIYFELEPEVMSPFT